MGLRVCLYLEMEEALKVSGIGSAIRNQRKALDLNGVEHTSDLNEDFDVFHLNILGVKSLYHIWRMKRRGVKIVIHAHTTAADFRNSFLFSNKVAPLLRRFLTFYYNRADLVLCPSEYTKNVLRKAGVTVPIKPISNGIDQSKFNFYPEKRRFFRSRYHLDEDELVPLSVGHLFIRKGVDCFMDAARDYDSHFVWVGKRYEKLESRRIRSILKKRPENVVLLGFIDDITEAYSGSDIFFFPSRCENQGIALLEAAACRLPILCRDLPAYEGWLVDEKNCLKFNTKKEMDEKLNRLMNDPDLRKRLGENACEMSKEHSLENVGAKLKNVYLDLLEK